MYFYKNNLHGWITKKTFYYNIMNLIVISFFVYIFVNLFENIIHYNIGRFSKKEAIFEQLSKKEAIFELPCVTDFIKIAGIVCIFALIQGLLTNYLNKFLKK